MLAARDAEMKVSPHIKPYQASGRNGGGQRARRNTARAEDEPRQEVEADQPIVPPAINKTPYQVLIEILSPDMQEDEQQAIWTLIRYLKKKEAGQ
jgi:hypothetical protein